MKPAIVPFILFASLITGCGQNPDGAGRADYYAERPAATEGERGREEYLAYEHSVSVDVDEDEARRLYEKVLSVCNADAKNGCTVLDASLTAGRSVSARIRMRIEPEGIGNIMGIVAAAGEVVKRSIHVEDLARPIVDNEKRREMLTRYQRQLMQLQREARHDVDALVKISKELATVQSQMEQAAGESAHLRARVNMDILDIYISTRIHRAFWSPVGHALSDFSSNLSHAVASVVVGLAYVIPWSIVVLLGVAIVRKAWRYGKARS